MKKLLAISLLGWLFFDVHAQKPPIKFGNVSMEEMSMKVYDKDTTASAVILADYGEVRIDVNLWKLIYERHCRIKILKKEGTRHANIEQPLWHGTENLAGLKAVSYNLVNGKIEGTKLSNNAVFQEKYSKFIDIKKFTMPNVQEGTVVEFEYKIYSGDVADYPNWTFQHDIPVIHSEFRATIPDFFVFEKYMQGYLTLDYETKQRMQGSYMEQTHRYTLHDGPAFKEEPYMTSELDYISRINFALSHINYPNQPVREIMGSWDKLVKDLIESETFGGTIRSNNFLKKYVEEATAGIDEPEKKARAIYNFVKENVAWDGTKDMLADPLRRVLDDKKGTAADLNLLLGSMLEKAGFEVEPIILSTRDHGFIRRQFPMQRQFNYTIVSIKLNNETVLLDATEKYLPFGWIPEHCLNGDGIKISLSTKLYNWFSLAAAGKTRKVLNSDLKLDATGSLSGTAKYTHNGYNALKTRKRFISKGKEDYLKGIKEDLRWEIEESDFQDPEAADVPFVENFTLSIDDHADVAGGTLYLNPFIGTALQENPFKRDKREYPVDFGSPFEEVVISKISIPDGFSVDELPESKVIALPKNGGRFIYNVAVTGNQISITTSLNINKALFVQDEYPVLREFYNILVAKQAEQIVIKKQ